GKRLVRSPLLLLLLLLLLLDLGIHPEDLPMVAVEVVEAPAVHEAVVLRIHGVLSAGGDGPVHHFVHLRSAAAREREERLRVLRRIAELPPRERLEEGLTEQHDVGLLADDHASGLVVGELRVEPEAQLREEVHRPLQCDTGPRMLSNTKSPTSSPSACPASSS